MAEKCPHCEATLRNGEKIVECPNCGKIYHSWCWKYVSKCENCGYINTDSFHYKIENNIETLKEEKTISNIENSTKQNSNKGNIISGIVFILFGVIILGMNTGVYGSSHIEFGGDFYTEIYNELTNVLDNLVSIGNILKYGFGFLLIGLGVDRLTKK